MLLHGDAAIAEARLLHPLQEGYFVLAQKTGKGRYGWKEKSFRMGLLEEAVSAVKRDPINRYISQASFVGPRRGVAHLHALRSAFIDMDCQQKLGVAPDAKFINSVLVRAGQIGIPEPTMIIRSGRGLYAKWIFDRSITAAQLDKWKLVNDALLDLFQDFGADMKVRDAARVLRVLGSTNSKANRGTEIVQLEHENPVLHDFDFLCSQVAAASLIHGARKCDEQPRAERARRERIVERAKLLNEASPTDLRGLVDFEALRRPILVDDTGRGGSGRYGSRSKEGLNWRRFVDLRNLILARGGAPKGTRDQYVFWMLNHLCLSGMVAPGNFESEAQSLIHLFPRHDGFNPLEDGSLSTLSKKLAASMAGEHIEYRGKSYNPLYTPTNDYLINAFEITPTEEVGMTTIISSSEKQRRSDLHCPGRTERREAREGRIEIIRQVFASSIEPNAASLPIGTLTKALGISERQARRVANKTLGRGSREQVLAGRIGLARELLSSGEHPDKVAEQMGITRRQLQRWIPQATVEQALRSLQRQSATPTPLPLPPALRLPPSSPVIEAKTHTSPESLPTAPPTQKIPPPPALAHPEGDKPGGRTYRTLLPVSIRELGCLSKVLDSFGFRPVGGAQECCGQKIKLPQLKSSEFCENGQPTTSALVGTETSPLLNPSRISCSSAIREDGGGQVAGWYGHGPPPHHERRLRPLRQGACSQSVIDPPGSDPMPTEPASKLRAGDLLAKARKAMENRGGSAALRPPHQSIGTSVNAAPAEEASSPTTNGTYKPTAQANTTADDPFGDTLFDGYTSEYQGDPSIGQGQDDKTEASKLAPVEQAETMTQGDSLTADRSGRSGTQDRHANSRPVFGSGTRHPQATSTNAAQALRPTFGAATTPSVGVSSGEGAKDPSLDPPWTDPNRPAGSGYSVEEWAQAREDGKFHVIELLSGQERGLVRFDARKTPESSGWSITLGRAFDGCMLIGPGASPNHPNHVRDKAVVVTDSGKKTRNFTYGIIEPTEMTNPWGRGACLTIAGSGLIDAPVYIKTEIDTLHQDQEAPQDYPRNR